MYSEEELDHIYDSYIAEGTKEFGVAELLVIGL